MFAQVHSFVHVCEYTRVCMFMRVRVLMCERMCLHMSIYAFVGVHHWCVYACVGEYVSVYMGGIFCKRVRQDYAVTSTNIGIITGKMYLCVSVVIVC